MMTTIELCFLAHRYHGTAWGRHVNEGVAEWPPSPYRLLRAMYDAWKRKYSSLSEGEVQTLFEALASNPPRFTLPRAVVAHTRSYLSSNTENRSDKSLIFDAFVALAPKAQCFLEWDVALTAEQRRTLSTLLSSLNYLGRSESWVEARLTESAGEGFKCEPCLSKDAGQEIIYVACALPVSEYKLKQPSWIEALAYSTTKLLKDKLSGPPAMQYVPYMWQTRADARAKDVSDAVTTWLPHRPVVRHKRLSAAVLELHGKVLPMATDTVRVAERIRGRLMRHFERSGIAIPPMVHGKDENGAPLKDHTHLFILPRANRMGRIDHVLIYTRSDRGFAEGVEDAVANVRRFLWIEPIRAIAAWMGRADDPQIRPMARTVVSSTPFVTVRHWRRGRGTDLEFLEREIRRECSNHGLPEPVRIAAESRVGSFATGQFRRCREGDPSRKGMGFRLEFAEEVAAPFSLGYGSHFGLGQFEKA
jgi:CRISPR-associated protein Csb2